MRILYFGNNWLGWQVLKWLKSRDEEIAGLVVHEPGRQNYGPEINSVGGLPHQQIFCGSSLGDSSTLEAIEGLRPDIGISVLFGYILAPRLYNLFARGCINLHPSYLPYNRGAHPNVWSIVDDTQAGTTLHYIDSGIDTGETIARQEVRVEPIDTGKTLYWKLMEASLALFKETWPRVKAGDVGRIDRRGVIGTYHRSSDVENIDFIDPDRTYKARDLIDVIRARTFSPYRGAYTIIGGQRIYLRLELLYEEDVGKEVE